VFVVLDICSVLLLADGAANEAAPSPYSMLPALVAIGILFYVMMVRPEKRKQAELKSLLDGIKKNDRIITVGGIFGVVTNVQGERVTIRVDEANNTKIDITLGSVSRIIVDEPAGDSATKS
jgi:preprotein translocase subunit YajC